MKKRFENDDCEKLLREFEQATIDPNTFGHEKHVQVAWTLLRRRGFDEALTAMDEGIRTLAIKHGFDSKYHATITGALMRLIVVGMNEGLPDETWVDFLARNETLRSDAFGLLQRYYTKDVLMSETARTRFVEPDRASFPAVLGGVSNPLSAA